MKPLPLVSCFRFLAAGLLLASGATLRAADVVPQGDVPPSVLIRFDKNKDGKLDEAERAKWEAEKAQRRAKDAARRADLLARFDANKDGRIDADEGAAAKLAMAQERTEADAVKMKARMEKEAAKLKAEEEAATAAKVSPVKPEQGADSMTSDTMTVAPAVAAPAKEGADNMMMQP